MRIRPHGAAVSVRAAVAAIAAIALARVVYQVWLSPYELVADEAQYWDWSRRLSLSYYSKGPGIAWLIAPSTALFGVSEWSVRLPATLAFAVTAAVVARLGIEFSTTASTAPRAALIGALSVSLLPAYQLLAIVMTIDAPYIACWALAVLAGWRAFVGERDGRQPWLAWLACGAALGVGFLFKYSIVLLVPGFAWFALMTRSQWHRRAIVRALAASAVMVVTISPVIVWNQQHQGAGLGHLLGYLALPGGDRVVQPSLRYDPLWTADFVFAQLAIIGPVLAIALMSLARGWTQASRFAACCAAPTLLFFLIATLRTRVEANWPAAAYVSLLPIAACAVAEHADTRLAKWWSGAVAYGVVALLVIHAPLAAAELPWLGRYVPTHRFRGFAERARALGAHTRTINNDGGAPLIIATSHNAAGLLAFYLPGRPVVASAGRYLGDRPSAYDSFSDTSLTSPVTHGRRAVLIGGTFDTWQSSFHVDDLTLLSDDGPQYASTFHGPRQSVVAAAARDAR